jgi:hypothetical protein
LLAKSKIEEMWDQSQEQEETTWSFRDGLKTLTFLTYISTHQFSVFLFYFILRIHFSSKKIHFYYFFNSWFEMREKNH